MFIESINYAYPCMIEVLLFFLLALFYKWENWSSQGLNNLPKFTEQVRGRARNYPGKSIFKPNGLSICKVSAGL